MAAENALCETHVERELLQIEEKGNYAIQNGKLEECLDWYLLGLRKAKELNYRTEIRKFSLLVATII